jgi:nucleoside-diphosphate-sugar epimerase
MSVSTERFLVTGAAGCIGAWTTRLLLDAGVDVVASDLQQDLRRLRLISPPGADNEPVFRELDVTRTEDVATVVREEGITHIVHLAGLQVPFCAANPPLGAMVNVAGTTNVFEAVRHAGRGVGLAYASSAAVFGNSSFYPGGAVSDTSPPLPETFYGVYKVANEQTARIYSSSHGIGSIGLRPFVVYGPGRDQGRTSDITVAMVAAAAGVPFRIGFGGNSLLTYASDCAAAFIGAARAAAGSGDAVCLNVPGRRMGIPALVDLVETVLPSARGLITWADTTSRTPALLAQSALADAIGDVANRPIADGVADTIAHFRRALAEGLLQPPAATPARAS